MNSKSNATVIHDAQKYTHRNAQEYKVHEIATKSLWIVKWSRSYGKVDVSLK